GTDGRRRAPVPATRPTLRRVPAAAAVRDPRAADRGTPVTPAGVRGLVPAAPGPGHGAPAGRRPRRCALARRRRAHLAGRGRSRRRRGRQDRAPPLRPESAGTGPRLRDYTVATMPVPLPDADTVVLARPDADEVAAVARGVASAVAPAGGLTDFQRILIEAVFHAMTGYPVQLGAYPPTTAQEFATVLARREHAFRSRMVQSMLTSALVLRPLPEEVADRIAAFAYELGVDDAMIDVARQFSHGALGLAAFDFERNGYTKDWAPEEAASLHTSGVLASAWDVAV